MLLLCLDTATPQVGVAIGAVLLRVESRALRQGLLVIKEGSGVIAHRMQQGAQIVQG